jgi:hypothetical protein
VAESAAQKAEAITAVAQTAQNLEPAAQLAAVNAVISPPDAKTTSTLWIILVSGLLGLLIIAIGGLIYLLGEDIDGSDVVLTVFSSVLAGLLGLFSQSPVKAGGG